MTVLAAAGWGAATSAPLWLGQALARPMDCPRHSCSASRSRSGGTVSLAFVVAVFVSNVPQGVAGTASLLAAGRSQRQVCWLWGA